GRGCRLPVASPRFAVENGHGGPAAELITGGVHGVSKPYDAAGKELLLTDPDGWAALLGAVRPPDRVDVIESDMSTVTSAADKVIRVKYYPAWLIDVEFQSWRDPAVPWQLLKYNALLHEKHDAAVASVLVVLAEKADSPAYTG